MQVDTTSKQAHSGGVESMATVVKEAVSGHSQQDIAAAAGLEPSTLSKIIHGKRGVNLDELAAIEAALELPRGTLLRRGGYVEDITTAREALASDPYIDEPNRVALLHLYDALARRVTLSSSPTKMEPTPARRRRR